jgi:hypothetical protein
MKQLNENKMNVRCQWMESKRLLINPDGQVLPCCYLANVIYMFDKLDVPEDRPVRENNISNQIGDRNIIQHETFADNTLMQYYTNKEKYNIHNVGLEEIIGSEWFTKTLPESWDSPNRIIRQCEKYCTKKNDE